MTNADRVERHAECDRQWTGILANVPEGDFYRTTGVIHAWKVEKECIDMAYRMEQKGNR